MVSCKNKDYNFEVTGEIHDAENQLVVLNEMTLENLVPIDSARIKNDGNFELKGFTDVAKFYSLQLENGSSITLAITPGDEIEVTANAEKLEQSYEVEGSDDSKMIRQLVKRQFEAIQKISKLGKIYQDSIESENLMEIKAKLDSTYDRIMEEHKNYTVNFIKGNPGSLASLMALYHDLGPRNYVMDPGTDLKYFVMVDSAMQELYPTSEAVKSLHKLVIDYEEKQKQQALVDKRLGIGAVAPEIALPNPDGDTISLSSLRGNYVLLDFWASWCNPCREENPNLVKNYKKFSPKGFDIYQVSLDRNRDAWLKGIKTDNLNWTHVSDLKYWNSMVVPVYHIQGIPTNYLLDPGGKIVAKNLMGEELTAKLREIYN
jgi:peroxiredoxin